MTDTTWLDATAQADLVRRGDVSSAELVDAAIERVEKVNPEINAVIHERFDRARAEAASPADGPFKGVPYVLKDLVAMSEGDPHHGGFQGVKDAGWMGDFDSELVKRFRAAGLICVGKSNTPELGLVPSTEPLAYGPSRNPWDTTRSTGGSSGGSAAAVAAGMVAIGHANDGGGSIRIPASECGLVGLKPSRGRVPLFPAVAEAWGGLVAELAVTRSVRDTAAILDAVSAPYPGSLHTPPAPARPYADEVGADPGRLRIGLLIDAPDGATPTHPDCVAAAQHAARLLESAGHTVELLDGAGFHYPEFVDHFLPCYSVWTANDVELYGTRIGRPLTEADMEPHTWALAEMGRAVTGQQYHANLNGLHRISAQIQSWWANGWDLLLTPTIPEPPPTLGQFTATPDNPLGPVFRAALVVPYTAPFNVTGQPAVSLPLHWSDAGLPIGVQLVAEYGREDVLIRVASQLEQAEPWAERRPAV